MNLLLDLGNSCLKWACVENNQLEYGKTLSHYEITPSYLQPLWQNLKPQKIAISCVGKLELLNVITHFIKEIWQDVPIHFATTQSEAMGVKNGYFSPQKLGVDRWLCLGAVRKKTKLNACIVDCGTAITLDILNENGCHQGGVIGAGLTLMKDALALHTADLPFSTIRIPKIGLAIETETAIFNGTLFSACGLIEKVMSLQPKKTTLFLTGGDAEIISSQLNYPFILEKNLVLQGLAMQLATLMMD